MSIRWNELHLHPRLLAGALAALLAAGLAYFLQFTSADPVHIYGVLAAALVLAAWVVHAYIVQVRQRSIRGLYRQVRRRLGGVQDQSSVDNSS